MASGLLISKVKTNRGMAVGSVFENQIDLFQTSARAISEAICWSHILDELLSREDLAPGALK